MKANNMNPDQTMVIILFNINYLGTKADENIHDWWEKV